MKKLLPLLAFCLLLCGCREESATVNTTEPSQSISEEVVVAPTTEQTQPPEDTAAFVQTFEVDVMIPVLEFIPELLVELKYATADNFTENIIYDSWDPFLRYGTLQKLMTAEAQFRELGFRLKLWDGFRPVSAQEKLWQIYPDKNYVSHPETGYRGHCRGNAIDVTLCDAEGRELEMPSGFDDFTAQADWDFSDCSDSAANNAWILRSVMENCGFQAYQSEWWHFTDSTVYPVEVTFEPTQRLTRWAVCQEYITLREAPDTSAAEILRIPAGEQMTLLAYDGEFAFVSYGGILGYVLKDYMGSEQKDAEPEIIEEVWLNCPWYYADCREFISLRENPDVNAAVITQIPAGGKFQLLESADLFGFVDYQGIYGYVLLEYIAPVQ